MMAPEQTLILVIDDNAAIHDDFRKILCGDPAAHTAIAAAEAEFFGDAPEAKTVLQFEIDAASQGQEGLALVERAMAGFRPDALAFVDVRMPPGWDGIETVARLWKVCPQLQVVLCTAYSDYSWAERLRSWISGWTPASARRS